jgi:hypothetical protein
MATAIAIAGTLVTGVMNYTQSMYQAQVAKQNAAIAQENANRAFHKGQIDAEDSGRQTAGLIADQEAIQGGSGLSVTGKSQLRTRRSARSLGRLDAFRLIAAGQEQQYNHLIDKMNFKSEAKARKFSAYAGLAGTALSVAGQVVGRPDNTTLLGTAKPIQNYDKYAPKPISKPNINLMRRKLY